MFKFNCHSHSRTVSSDFYFLLQFNNPQEKTLAIHNSNFKRGHKFPNPPDAPAVLPMRLINSKKLAVVCAGMQPNVWAGCVVHSHVSGIAIPRIQIILVHACEAAIHLFM